MTLLVKYCGFQASSVGVTGHRAAARVYSHPVPLLTKRNYAVSQRTHFFRLGKLTDRERRVGDGGQESLK